MFPILLAGSLIIVNFLISFVLTVLLKKTRCGCWLSGEKYINNLGKINKELGQLAEQVIEVVYTIPIYIKGEV